MRNRKYIWSAKCPSAMCLVGEISVGMCLVREMSVGEISDKKVSVGDVSGWGNIGWGSVPRGYVHQGCVHWAYVRRGSVRRGCVWLGKCRSWMYFIGEVSVGEMSVGEVFGHPVKHLWIFFARIFTKALSQMYGVFLNIHMHS